MNVLRHIVTEVLSGPTRRVDEEYCCWEVTVEYDCYGCLGKKTFRCVTRSEAEAFVPGYTWHA